MRPTISIGQRLTESPESPNSPLPTWRRFVRCLKLQAIRMSICPKNFLTKERESQQSRLRKPAPNRQCALRKCALRTDLPIAYADIFGKLNQNVLPFPSSL